MAPSTDVPEHNETVDFPPFPPLLSRWATVLSLAILLLDTFLLPAILYYILQFGTSLSEETIFDIVTSAAGALDLFHYAWRFWALMKKNPKFRPKRASRWAQDFVQHNYTIAVVIVVVELVVGTINPEPLVRLCAMPIPSLLFQIGLTDLLMTFLHVRTVPIPFRISSCIAGETFRPSIYFYAEDLGAIDGGGGLDWREALDVRYRASGPLRQMFVKLSLFWSVPAVLMGAALTAIVFTVPKSVAFGIGWCGAVPWLLVWVYISYRWVPKVFAREQLLRTSLRVKQ